MNIRTRLNSNQLEMLDKANLIYGGIARIKIAEDAIRYSKTSTTARCASLINILSNFKVSQMTGYILYKSALVRFEHSGYESRKPMNIIGYILEEIKYTDELENRFNQVLRACHSDVAKALEEIVDKGLICQKDREKYKIEFETLVTYIGRTGLLDWILCGEYNGCGFFPWSVEYDGTEYPMNLMVGSFSLNLVYVLGRANVLDLKQVYMLNELGSYTKLLKHIRYRTHVNVELVTSAISELRKLGYFSKEFIWDAVVVESSENKQVQFRASDIWIYELQDGITGGIVLANNEQDAKERVCREHRIKIDKFKDVGEVYPLTCLDLNKASGVHQLW